MPIVSYENGKIENAEHCVCCGKVIPEGSQYCIVCGYKVKQEPKIDLVNVVRCKDCVHWGGVTYGFICRKFSGIETKICMGADNYCSYGERKEK